MSSALRYLPFLQGFISPFPRSAREHEPSPSHNRSSTSCSDWLHADRCRSFSSFLIPPETPNSCPMAFAPLTDLTPVEAHRRLAWLHVRLSPGCLSILADRTPGLCAGGTSLPTNQFCGAIPACHQGMDRDGRQGHGERRVNSYLGCS